jgi:hypothetical protein
MTLTNFEFSSSYQYLDQALRSRWQIYANLEAEMDSFQPRPASDYHPLRAAEVERLRILNPEGSLESLKSFVDHQITITSSDEWQFHEAFEERHVSEYVIVTVLAQALSEAVINTILAIGLANAGSPELFEMLDKAEFKQKWVVAPKALSSGYSFPIGTALHETLGRLAKQRNSLAHSKIDLKVGEEEILRGKLFERLTRSDERRWIKRFFSLPYDHMDFANNALPELPLSGILHERSPIPKAPEHGT